MNSLENIIHNIKYENFYKNLKPMSLDQLNHEIDKAVDDENNDRLIDVKDLKNKLPRGKPRGIV